MNKDERVNAAQLKNIAKAAIDEDKVNRLVQDAFNSAMKAAQKGKFSAYLTTNEHHADPDKRTNPAEQAEIIRRIEGEGFLISRGPDGTKMHWS